MRRATALVVTVSLLVMVFSGMQPSLADIEEGAETIGQYQRLGSSGDLKPEHVSRDGEVLKIKGPVFTSKLKVDMDYLENELGAWGSQQAFAPGERFVEFDTRSASFVPLELGAESIFSWGHESQIEFLERPMWVSAVQEEHAGAITLEIEDGDTTGQSIYIAKAWLWERGIHRPNATHEDGTVLPVNKTENGEGFVIEVHHFSDVRIDPEDLEVMGRQNGLLVPHLSELRWYENESRLEIDVSGQLDDYDVLIEMDWVSVNVGAPWVWANDYAWGAERVDEEAYHVASLSPDDTPTTLVIMDAPWQRIDIEFNFTDFKDKIESGVSVTLPLGWNASLETLLLFDSEPWNVTVLDENGQLKQVLARNLTADQSGSDHAPVNLVLWDDGFLGERCLPDPDPEQSNGQQNFYNTLTAGELSVLSTIPTSADNVHLLPQVAESSVKCRGYPEFSLLPWVLADAEAKAEQRPADECEGDPRSPSERCYEMSERSGAKGPPGQWGEVKEVIGHFTRTCTWKPPEDSCGNPWKSATHWDEPQDPTDPTHNPCVNLKVVAAAGIRILGYALFPLSTHSAVAEAWCT